METLPFQDWPDSTITLLRDPYRHILSRCRKLGTQGFRTRLLGKEAVCLTGAEAARLVYDQQKFLREGAVPSVIRTVLFGEGGVQGLDNAAHHHRKSMFLKLMGPDSDLDQVVAHFETEFRRAAADWKGEIDVFEAMKCILARVAYDWADLPLAPGNEKDTADGLADLFLHAGPEPVGQIKARHSRDRLEHEIARCVEQLRNGEIEGDIDKALSVIGLWKDQNGELLSADVAAVELLNVVRPTVAIAVYLVFVAHALARHQSAVAPLRDDPGWSRAFVQEVRRTYPFFPATAAIAREDIVWQGETIRAGCRVILDIYGTNRDARYWDDPDTFSPARFLGKEKDDKAFIPQGAGDHAVTHRCPGEWLTIRIMERFTEILQEDLHWRLSDPEIDLHYSALPGLPKNALKISL
jgi:fatty-acid peroxygenase